MDKKIDRKEHIWNIVGRCHHADKYGFFVEALVLQIFLIRSMLISCIKNKLNDESKFKEKWNRQDLGPLTETAFQIKAIQISLRNSLKKFYNERGAVIHGYINQEIEYREIKKLISKGFLLINKVQAEFVTFEIGEIESYSDFIEKK